jgi:DNA/RNA-binding domain of Phe-tRNA-synthetase-like protein
MSITAADWIERSAIDPAVFARWPGYRAILVAVDRADTTALADAARRLLTEAHAEARRGEPAQVDPHTGRWHDAYRDFGVKPRVARPSTDALVRRAATDNGLPSINVLVDLYNAVSILHRVPIGGEDLDRYDGPARLVLADGTEAFHTTSNGEPTVDHPEQGEPIWIDDTAITCRRWNWRQTTRTAIDHSTARVGFIIDSLDAPGHTGAGRAAEQLIDLLPGAVTRTIDPTTR